MKLVPRLEGQICVVNCGLPGDQCACWRTAMTGIFAALLARQEPLGAEFEAALSANIESLYEN
jgi:hypothetical protein